MFNAKKANTDKNNNNNKINKRKTETKIIHTQKDRACISSVNCLRLFRNNTEYILLEYDYHRTKSLAIHIFHIENTQHTQFICRK